MYEYAELHAHSAYSFLDGANQPEELVAAARALGLRGLALTDHNGFYGVVRFAEAARGVGLPTIFGAELTLAQAIRPQGVPDPGGEHLVILARGPGGYQRLSRAMGLAHLATGAKGRVEYTLAGLAEQAGGDWVVLTGCRKGAVRRALEPRPGVFDIPAAVAEVATLVEVFGPGSVYVELTATGGPTDSGRLAALAEVAAQAGVGAVATGAVHCATPADQPLASVLAATRARMTLEEIDGWLPAAPAFLRSPAEMGEIFAPWPGALTNSVRIAQECAFDLALVAPNLPPFPVPTGHTETSWLRHLTYAGAADRYGTPAQSPRAYELIEHELRVIAELGFCGYFLIVHEIVEFCVSENILCQGRGSAANSAVCFSLGITAVDAVRHKLLFERFLSPGRSGPPDIDVDIEAGRREEVIQFVYTRYGRHHAAQVANVISYRPRSAIRDVARALGYDPGQQDAWAKGIERWGSLRPAVEAAAAGEQPAPGESLSERDRLRRDGPWTPSTPVEEAATGHTDGIPAQVVDLAEAMLRLPRHLGIHSGGMVICDRPIIDVVPVEWATKPGRTVVQWDKDDCADAGLVKFDLLGLGMLGALQIAFTTVRELTGTELGLHSIPQEDAAVYDLLCAAETVGVFQVESRAQIATLPRLQPRTFYDIVVEVALIRPGPIQGQSVHPYIERSRGRQPVTYLHPLLKPALEKTLGVPLFQEQLMQIAIDAAGFTPSEADELRRAMGSKRSAERMDALHDRLLAGMAARGIEPGIGEEIFDKLRGFSDFGFPESHAFSFAYLVYASAWLKVHHPEAFYAALLAAQPMGFYSPASLVADARRRGVMVARADVATSGAQAMVRAEDDGYVVLLGLAPVRGIGKDTATRIVTAREQGAFTGIADLARRAELSVAQMEALATAGALECFGADRRESLWSAGAIAQAVGRRTGNYLQPTLDLGIGSAAPVLAPMDAVTTAVADVWATGLSTDSFPTQFVRPQLDVIGVITSGRAKQIEHGTRARVAGVVTHRQRPATARGVTFLSLEDEDGMLNVICTAAVWARYRTVARSSAALIIRGMIERADGATNLMAETITELPLRVPSSSRDFQ